MFGSDGQANRRRRERTEEGMVKRSKRQISTGRRQKEKVEIVIIEDNL